MTPDAFHTMALLELDAVYRFAYHLCRKPHEAEDVVQETYLRALKAWDTFHPAEHGIRPWLFKILHNVVHTRLAKRKRDHDVLSDYGTQLDSDIDPFDHALVDLAEGQPSAESFDRIDWDGVDERLKFAVAELPMSHRVVFLLSAVEGLKYREIADLTEVPIGTVMSRLARARQSLLKRLADFGVEHNLIHDKNRHNADAKEVDRRA